MNLLSIQDALKNASDDQLVGMLQSPDASAPSYLVLTELKRRKDMRSKQEAQPQGTVAEDLSRDTTYDDQGIRSLKSPGYEEEQQQPQDEGIEAMREGCVVLIAAGDVVGGTPRPLQDLSEADIARYLDLARQRERLGFPMTGPGASPYTIEELLGQQQGLDEIRNLNPAEINRGAFAGSQNLPGSLGAGPIVPAPSTPAQTETNRGGNQTPPPSTTTTTNAPATGTTNPPAGQPTGATTPGGAARPANVGLPSLAVGRSPDFNQMYQENLNRFPSLPQDLQERLRGMRTKPEEERNRALNLSLMEAGLRMMASRSPTFLGAVGEGAAPAVQSYGQQLGQIRKDQREDIKDELSVAQANLARAYYAGQITSSQFRTATSELQANARALLGANAQIAAAERTAAGIESRERIAESRDVATAQRAADLALHTALRNPELRQQMRLSLQMERSQRGNTAPVTENDINQAIRGLGIAPGVTQGQGTIVTQDGVQRYVRPGS